MTCYCVNNFTSKYQIISLSDSQFKIFFNNNKVIMVKLADEFLTQKMNWASVEAGKGSPDYSTFNIRNILIRK